MIEDVNPWVVGLWTTIGICVLVILVIFFTYALESPERKKAWYQQKYNETVVRLSETDIARIEAKNSNRPFDEIKLHEKWIRLNKDKGYYWRQMQFWSKRARIRKERNARR